MHSDEPTRFNLKEFHKHQRIVWVQNKDQEEKPAKLPPSDDDFKRQHMQYIAKRLQNKQNQRKGMQKQLGLSSSDEDSDMEQGAKETQTGSKNRSAVENSGKYEVSLSSRTSKEASQPDLPMPEPKIKEKTTKNTEKGQKQLLILVPEKGGDIWKEASFEMQQKTVQGGGHCIALYDMSKLKLILSGFKQHYKLKITWGGQNWLFAASNEIQHQHLPTCFFVFATIVARKVQLMGRKLTPLAKGSLTDFPPMAKESIMFGRLLRKSRMISRWNEVFGVIRGEGLFIFKKAGEKGDLLVPRGTINQLWTRFEYVEQHLIIKLFQGSSKIELGIPLYDYRQESGWLYHLYALKH